MMMMMMKPGITGQTNALQRGNAAGYWKQTRCQDCKQL